MFLPGESQGQRSLARYSPRGCKELTEQLTLRYGGPQTGNKFWTKGIIHSSMLPYSTSPWGRFPVKPFNLLFSLHPKQKQTLTDAAP